MGEIVRKVQAACAFGSPDNAITREIVDEVAALVKEREKLVAIQEILASVTNSSEPERWADALENISGVIDD